MSDRGSERFKLEPHAQEARVVERLFKEVLKGCGLAEITRRLNRKGIAPPRGKTWGKHRFKQY